MQQTAISEQCWVEVGEAARRLGVSVWTVRNLAESRRIPHVRFGPRGHYRFRTEDLDAFLEASRVAVAS